MVQNIRSRLIQSGLIQVAAYLGRKSVRINALKCCPRLAEAVNDCCACSVLTQTFMAERRPLQWRENEFCLRLLHLKSGKRRRRRIEIHLKKRNVSGAADEKLILLMQRTANFLWQIINYLRTQHQSWPKRQFKMKRAMRNVSTAFFGGQSQSFSFFDR